MAKIKESELLERVVSCYENLSEEAFIDEVNDLLGTDYTPNDIEWTGRIVVSEDKSTRIEKRFTLVEEMIKDLDLLISKARSYLEAKINGMSDRISGLGVNYDVEIKGISDRISGLLTHYDAEINERNSALSDIGKKLRDLIHDLDSHTHEIPDSKIPDYSNTEKDLE